MFQHAELEWECIGLCTKRCNREAAQDNKKQTKTVIQLYQYQYSALYLVEKIICIIYL